MADDNDDPWAPGTGFNLESLLDRMTDEQLIAMGINRSMSPEEIMVIVKNDAMKQWAESEEAIEALVAQAQDCILAHLGEDRMQGMAQFYGETMQTLSNEELDPEYMLDLVLYSIFKLAEARNAQTSIMDGNRR